MEIKELNEFYNELHSNLKKFSLADLEKMLRTKNYPQIRRAQKILKNAIACKIMTLRDRDWC